MQRYSIKYAKNLIFSVILLAHSISMLQAQPKVSKGDDVVFLCRPCGLPCDTVKHKYPGICEVCNMPLFATYSWRQPVNKVLGNTLEKAIAILVFPGVQIIDFTGPYEVF